ncbi:hypothetical protein ACTXT7_002221 [Hymenolepis weldensis]
MEETYFGHNSRQSRFSKFVDEIPPDDLIEIPLSSDGENDIDESSNDTKHSPINIQSIFPSNSTSKSVIQDFFESAYSPSLISHECNSTQYFQDSNHDDIDDDLKFNEELANSIRHQCSLFSPSLVRAINSDIKEIKRSLNASKDGEKLHSGQSPSDEHDRLVKCHCHGRNGGQRRSHNPSRSFYVNRGVGQTKAKMIKSNRNKKEEMTVRQWNFAAPSNAVYSTSSDSEGANSGNNSTATNSDAEVSPRVSKSSPVSKISTRDQTHEEEEEEGDGQWSLQRCPPCPPKYQSLRPLSAGSGSSAVSAGASNSHNNHTNSTSKSLRPQRTKKPQSNLELASAFSVSVAFYGIIYR